MGTKLVASMLAAALGAGQMVMPGGAVSVASAQQPPHETVGERAADAGKHFRAGKAHFDAGEFGPAYGEFVAADEALPNVLFAARMAGFAADKSRRYKEALAYFEKFVGKAGATTLPRLSAADIKTQVDEIKPRLTELRRTVPQMTQQVNKSVAEGEKKFKAGDYPAALAALQAADQVMETPRVSFLLGQTLENMGKPADAVPPYEAFLIDNPKGSQRDVADVKARVEKIKGMPGKVHVETQPPGATVAIDGTAAPSPTPGDYEVPVGHHTLLITMQGREPKEVPVDVTFAATVTVPPVELREKVVVPPPITTVPVATVTPPPVTPPPATPPVTEARSTLPAIVTGGLAIAAAGVGTVFGILTLSDKSDYNKNPTSSKADDGENHALIADMSFFVAVTLGVTSLVLFLTKDEPPQSASAAARSTASAKRKSNGVTITAAPVVTPHGGGAGALIRF